MGHMSWSVLLHISLSVQVASSVVLAPSPPQAFLYHCWSEAAAGSQSPREPLFSVSDLVRYQHYAHALTVIVIHHSSLLPEKAFSIREILVAANISMFLQGNDTKKGP